MAFLVKMLGCSPDTSSYTVPCVLLLKFALPGKRPVYCIGSTITSLCGVFHFAPCLRGWADSSGFFVIFVIVRVRVVCVTLDITGIILVAFNLLFVRHSVHKDIPNCLTLVPFRGVSQSVHTCRSPSGPD